MNNKLIAFYLPQYHPTPSNDLWWGKGFTEWTNVCKAKPLFRGHYQPHLPADLGFYDLRLEQTRIEQANLAREYGISGFCYYHYWFGNGRQELELPFNEVLASKKPDFPFMLCWANESWHAKFWDKDGSAFSKKTLVEQVYGGIDDYTKHFYHLLPAFKDERYIKHNGKPMFMIYQPLLFDEVKQFVDLWQKLAKENGLKGICFVAQCAAIDDEKEQVFYDRGFEYINSVHLYDILKTRSIVKKIYDTVMRYGFNKPFVESYKRAVNYFTTDREAKETIIPTIIPNWDHSPRSKTAGYVLQNSTPKYFSKHLKKVFNLISKKENKVAFIKSWNEWGECNYIEPDLQYGKQYLEIIKEQLDKNK